MSGLWRGVSVLLTSGLMVLWSGSAAAHARSLSYGHWQLDDAGGTAAVRVSQLDLSRLGLDPRHTPDYLQAVAARVAGDLTLWSTQSACRPGPVQARSDDASGWVHLRWAVRCDGPPAALRTRLFESVAPAHLHIAVVVTEDGMTRQQVLGFADPVWHLTGPAAPTLSGFRAFVAVGFGHILSGADHLVFVGLLLLLAAGLREVVVLASVFTLAHCLTLALAALGWLRINSAWVEALIGLSIVLVAAEYLWTTARRDRGVPILTVVLLAVGMGLLWPAVPATLALGVVLFSACYFALLARHPRPQALRLLLVFGFGLVHGLGFAGEMLALAVPRDALLPALLGFNLGVELGQLAVIAVAWPLLGGVARWPALASTLRPALGVAALSVGSFWWVARILG